jgi:hypothetical protein
MIDEITIIDVTGTDQLHGPRLVFIYFSHNSTSGMTTRSKRASDEMRGELEVKSEAGSELEELNEEEYERERLENIKYVPLSLYISNLLSISSRFRIDRR